MAVLVGSTVRRADLVLLMGMAVMIDAELLSLEDVITRGSVLDWLHRAFNIVPERRRQRCAATMPDAGRARPT
jgi:hypothetical protein